MKTQRFYQKMQVTAVIAVEASFVAKMINNCYNSCGSRVFSTEERQQDMEKHMKTQGLGTYAKV